MIYYDREKEKIIAELFNTGRDDVSVRVNDDNPEHGIFYEIIDFDNNVLYQSDFRTYNTYPNFAYDALKEYRVIRHTIELSKHNKEEDNDE